MQTPSVSAWASWGCKCHLRRPAASPGGAVYSIPVIWTPALGFTVSAVPRVEASRVDRVQGGQQAVSEPRAGLADQRPACERGGRRPFLGRGARRLPAWKADWAVAWTWHCSKEVGAGTLQSWDVLLSSVSREKTGFPQPQHHGE